VAANATLKVSQDSWQTLYTLTGGSAVGWSDETAEEPTAAGGGFAVTAEKLAISSTTAVVNSDKTAGEPDTITTDVGGSAATPDKLAATTTAASKERILFNSGEVCLAGRSDAAHGAAAAPTGNPSNLEPFTCHLGEMKKIF
jgi:hypothetical protein